MDNLLKKIYKLYISEDNFDEFLNENEEYRNATDRIDEIEDRLKELYKNTEYHKEIRELLQEYFDLYIKITDLTRYQDFVHVLTLGAYINDRAKPRINKEFIKKLSTIINME